MIPAGQLVPGGPGVVDGRIRFSPDTPLSLAAMGCWRILGRSHRALDHFTG